MSIKEVCITLARYMHQLEHHNKSYRALARKYRPQKFSDLIGQEMTVRVLINAMERGRFPHALILTGMRGVGKTTIARLIAKSINCLGNRDDFEGCGICEECISIANGVNPDVLEMDAASNTSVNDIRDVIESSRYKPVNSRYRIFIIDEVHMLSTSAFNALLKTLEEPPAHVKFILATTEIHKIPLTIISRCQKFNLKRFSQVELKNYYIEILKKEKISCDDAALNVIADAADGSVRDGLSLLDQAISIAEGSVISFQDVYNMIGVVDLDVIYKILNAIVSRNTREALDAFASAYWGGYQINRIIQDMLNVIHQATKVKMLNITADDQKINEFANKVSSPFLLRLWSVTVNEEMGVYNQFAAAEMLIMKLISIDIYGAPEKIIQSLDDTIKSMLEDSSEANKMHNGRNDVYANVSESGVNKAADIVENISEYSELHQKKLHPNTSRVSDNKDDISIQKSDNIDRDTSMVKEGAVHPEMLDRLFDMIAERGDIELYSVIRNDVEIVSLDLMKKHIEIRVGSNHSAAVVKRIGELGDDWHVVILGVDEGAVQNSISRKKEQAEREEINNLLNHSLVRDIVSEIEGIDVDDAILD